MTHKLREQHLVGLKYVSGSTANYKSPIFPSVLYNNTVCNLRLEKPRRDELLDEREKPFQASNNPADRCRPDHSGLACSCPAHCFHKGQSSEAPWQIPRCNWKRLLLRVSLRPQCFCLHVQRDSDLYAHLKSSHSTSWPDVTGVLLHWSIGCERPWERERMLVCPEGSSTFWLWSSKI